ISAGDGVLPGQPNDDVVNELRLPIETVGEDAGSLSAVVLGDRVIDQERSPRPRWNHPIHAAASGSAVAAYNVLNDGRVRLIDDIDSAALRVGAVLRDPVVLDCWRSCGK